MFFSKPILNISKNNSNGKLPVIISGGNLVGLSTAVFLRSRNVPTILIEKHEKISEHPRAIGFTARTMELYRSVGLSGEIPQVDGNFKLRRTRVESLSGKWFEEAKLWTPTDKKEEKNKIPDLSPCIGAGIPQDQLESILRKKAIQLGTDIRLSTELTNFTQDENGVTVSLKDRKNNQDLKMRGSYLIGADGNRSFIRESLGIKRNGIGHMKTIRSVLFKAPLEEYLQRGICQFDVDNADLKAFLTTYNDGRWVLMFSDDIERSQEQLKLMIYKAIGCDTINVEIITTGRWELTSLIAENFSSGRVFLAGDSAHTLPPNRGGYGANTGIEDAHNLAWKLASVLQGESRPHLLETYDAERRPIALLREQEIFARQDYKQYSNENVKKGKVFDDAAMELGQLYQSASILESNPDLPAALSPDKWLGQPGTRAPHAWVYVGNERLSTIDLFNKGWLLVSTDKRWDSISKQVSQQLGMELKHVLIGTDIQTANPDDLIRSFGLNLGGISLIRPDGYIAWRSVDFPSDPMTELMYALGTASCATNYYQKASVNGYEAKIH